MYLKNGGQKLEFNIFLYCYNINVRAAFSMNMSWPERKQHQTQFRKCSTSAYKMHPRVEETMKNMLTSAGNPPGFPLST